MKCILMNFDDRLRVVPALDKSQVPIGIGRAKEIDVDPGIYAFIKRAMEKTQDPLVILPEMITQPAEVIELMDILANMESAPYEDILRRTTQLIGQDNVGGPQPSRMELRNKLRQIAMQLAAGAKPSPEAIQSAAKEIEARNVAEEERRRKAALESDPDEKDRQLALAREATQRAMRDGRVIGQMPERVLSERDKTDLALGVIGGTADDLASALNQPPKGQPKDPDAFDPENGRPPRRAKRTASKQAKRAAKKATAGRASKKASKRIRA